MTMKTKINSRGTRGYVTLHVGEGSLGGLVCVTWDHLIPAPMVQWRPVAAQSEVFEAKAMHDALGFAIKVMVRYPDTTLLPTEEQLTAAIAEINQ